MKSNKAKHNRFFADIYRSALDYCTTNYACNPQKVVSSPDANIRKQLITNKLSINFVKNYCFNKQGFFLPAPRVQGIQKLLL